MKTSTPTTISELFNTAWDATVKIDFNPEWKNRTGYLDFATNDESLELMEGQYVATTDDLRRKVLIKGLGHGLNHVVFERDPKKRPGIYVSNTPHTRLLNKTGLDYFTNPYGSSLSLGTMKVFLNLEEQNVLFYPEFSSQILKFVDKTTLVSVGSALVTSIENSDPISVNHLKSVGINVCNFDIYVNIQNYNIFE